MTLEEMKRKSTRLIEEASTDTTKITDDPDIQLKLNDVINQIMFELARMKKIPAKEIMDVTEGEELELNDLDAFYQLNNIKCVNSNGEAVEIEVVDNFVTFKGQGTATIYYYKYPTRITDKTDDTKYIFELSDDALEVMPYGVAADILKSDVSNAYGNVYMQRYQQMKQELDPRYNFGSIFIEGGINV